MTVGAMTAISVAMTKYLQAADGVVPPELGAEVTIAKDGKPKSRNHFRNAGVGLFPEVVDLRERAHRITESLAERRARAAHPSSAASDRALEAVRAAHSLGCTAIRFHGDSRDGDGQYSGVECGPRCR